MNFLCWPKKSKNIFDTNFLISGVLASLWKTFYQNPLTLRKIYLGHIRPSICENAAGIECLSLGHSYTYVLGKCYYVEMDSFNYADAMDNCQNNFGSGNSGKLFEPRDAATNDQVIKFAARTMLPSTNQKIYIGMNDLVKEGTFQYATGGDLVYTNWYSGEPNNSGEQHCMAKPTKTPLFWQNCFHRCQSRYQIRCQILYYSTYIFRDLPKVNF